MRREDGANPDRRVHRLGGDGRRVTDQLTQRLGPDLHEHGVLVWEMHIERRRRHTDLVGDLADGRALIAAGDEDAFGGRQNLFAAFETLAARLPHALCPNEGPIFQRPTPVFTLPRLGH